MLEEKYSVQINATKASNQNLQDFFDNVKTGDEKTNETLDVVCSPDLSACEMRSHLLFLLLASSFSRL